MKKILILMLIALAIFVSCSAPTEVKAFSDTRTEPEIEPVPTYTFKDFFDPVTIVHASQSELSTAIVMDRNTGVLYLHKRTGYQCDITPIMMADSTVLTMEKFLEIHTEKKD